jgi:hypothetical protein
MLSTTLGFQPDSQISLAVGLPAGLPDLPGASHELVTGEEPPPLSDRSEAIKEISREERALVTQDKTGCMSDVGLTRSAHLFKGEDDLPVDAVHWMAARGCGSSRIHGVKVWRADCKPSDADGQWFGM